MKQRKKAGFQRIRLRLVLAAVISFVLCAMPSATVAAATHRSAAQQAMFSEAAQEFKVPQELLMAVSYYQSRWEDHDGEMSIDGGYGPMNLRTAVAVEDGRGDPRRPLPKDKKVTPQKDDLTLDQAAGLLQVSPETLKKDMRQNIRGGAAVLAERAKQLNSGQLPADMNEWYAVAGRFLGQDNMQNAGMFIDQIYAMLKSGKTATTAEGQQLQLPAMPNIAAPDAAKLDRFGISGTGKNSQGAECPRTVSCRFIPAGYAANSSDPADYGNYDHANRPQDMKVNYIVIHDTEGSYTSAISHFQDTHSYVSAHYVIRSSDGEITQMVPTSNVAWHAGDWYVNMHSIGIEHEGYAAEGASWYTEAMYQSSANLVRYLAKKYNIPLDRSHIIGHDNVPALTNARIPAMHWDPGPYWDWNHYMSLLTGQPADKLDMTGIRSNKNAVTISPTFATNVQTVNNCTNPADSSTCADLTAPSNFVYLRTEPRSDAPLITDPLLHTGGQGGTTKIYDWGVKATAGQQYSLAERQGDWTAIWFTGQKAWFYNPASQPTATAVRARTVKLKPGLAAANIYGGAYPESSVYPADVKGPAQPKLGYTILAGQEYVLYGPVPTDYFYDATIDYSKPHDHEVFKGQDRYLRIWYNHRLMYVKASDVNIQ